ncbi:MAG TPA: hypothetical protein VEI25_04440 [Paraburkholderia sp.]|nr:hypothetical protein [Paraburkholderia sp.]
MAGDYSGNEIFPPPNSLFYGNYCNCGENCVIDTRCVEIYGKKGQASPSHQNLPIIPGAISGDYQEFQNPGCINQSPESLHRFAEFPYSSDNYGFPPAVLRCTRCR